MTPLLLLDGELNVIAASMSFCRTFQIDPADAAGRQLFELDAGAWDLPQLKALLQAAVSGAPDIQAYEVDLNGDGPRSRRLVLNAHKLEYDDAEHVRLLLAVADVTDARASEKLKDNQLREKSILLQELQHRVANSLQIISSVLLQSARRVHSKETRSQLNEVHERVMSVAAVQQQLATTSLSDVQLRAYFTQLCESLGASMIRDHKQLSIMVSADDSKVDPDSSVSLGLIVTELVINALKHAFPGHRKGRIIIDYQAAGADWRLSVRDNGVGMPTNAASAKPGLGTSIVEALARQLGARVEVAAGKPGTSVSIIHEQVAAARLAATAVGSH